MTTNTRSSQQPTAPPTSSTRVRTQRTIGSTFASRHYDPHKVQPLLSIRGCDNPSLGEKCVRIQLSYELDCVLVDEQHAPIHADSLIGTLRAQWDIAAQNVLSAVRTDYGVSVPCDKLFYPSGMLQALTIGHPVLPATAWLAHPVTARLLSRAITQIVAHEPIFVLASDGRLFAADSVSSAQELVNTQRLGSPCYDLVYNIIDGFPRAVARLQPPESSEWLLPVP